MLTGWEAVQATRPEQLRRLTHASRAAQEEIRQRLFKSAEWIGWALGGLEREIARNERAAGGAHRAGGHAAEPRRGGGASRRRGARSPPARRQASGRTSSPRTHVAPKARKRISEMMKKRWLEAKKKNKNRL